MRAATRDVPLLAPADPRQAGGVRSSTPLEATMATSHGYGLESEIMRRPGPTGGGSIDSGDDWVSFAAIVLGFAGVLAIIDGVIGLAKSKFYAPNATYVFSDVRTWAWILLIAGIAALFAAGVVASGSQWGRWFGISMAALNGLGQLMFAQAYPWWSVAAFALDVLVIYALAVHGGKSYGEL